MASEDPMVPSTAATPFKQLSTTWAIGKIAGSHLLLQAVPHEVAKAVKNFIDRLR